jgi:hypothetical protein
MSSFSKNVGVLCILCILCILCAVYVFGESYTPPPITNAIRLGGGISTNTPNFITQNTIALPTIPPGIDNDTLNAYNAALAAYNAAYQTIKPVTTTYDAANNAVICPADKPIAMKNVDGTVTCIDKDSLASYCGVGEYWNGTSCVACPAGSYCPGDGYKYLCPSGSYCPSGASAPTPCAAGSYCPSGSSSTSPCPAGSYCPDPSTLTACPPGTYSTTSGATSSPCQPCPAGTYNSATGAIMCPSCSSGYCSSGSTTQGVCPADSYCPNTATKTLLPTNSTATADGTGFVCTAPFQKSTDNLSCVGVSCPVGQYASNGVCTNLPANSTVSSNGTNFVCNTGYQTSTDKLSCIVCPVGQYLLNGKCVACPAGSYCPDTSGVKQLCPAGRYCPVQGIIDPTQYTCITGYYCPEGSSTMTKCLDNTYSNIGQASCTAIPTNSTITRTLSNNECLNTGWVCNDSYKAKSLSSNSCATSRTKTIPDYGGIKPNGITVIAC